ncbi:MAG: hypothetical protein P9L94_03050 [Candidatus Hinthialibacter antarcticus]|nr:hypothetical protein [Candidatus Hinthialibacter antarcticus]
MRKVFRFTTVAATAFALCAMVNTSQAQVFVEEDFNTGGTAGAESRGWEFTSNEFVTETGVDFGVAEPTADIWPAGPAPSADTGVEYPPMANGLPTNSPFLFSDSDKAGGSDDIGSGAQVSALSPSFSTVGGSGTVWFHADAAIDINNNGEAFAFLDVSTDGGATWQHAWIAVEPERVIDAFNTPTDVNGNPTGSALIDGWPSIGPDPNNPASLKTFAGIHGRWHVPLPASVENQADVRIRLGWHETADAWWYAVDNVVIDNTPPPTGSVEILTEDFEGGIPAAWNNENLNTVSADPLNDYYGIPPIVWDTKGIEDPELPGEPFKLINGVPVFIDLLKQAESFDVVIDLETPDADFNPKGMTDGGWLLMLAGQGYALYQEGPFGTPDGSEPETAALDTPSLDLSNAVAAYIDFDSEFLAGTTGAKSYKVQVSVDGGDFEDIFDYLGALMNYGEAPFFDHHYLEVPQAAGSSNVVFRFFASASDPTDEAAPDFPNGNDDMEGFWAIDNVRVTADTSTSVPNWELF